MQLTNTSLYDLDAEWSPDGSKIVFDRGDNGTTSQVFVMNFEWDGCAAVDVVV